MNRKNENSREGSLLEQGPPKESKYAEVVLKTPNADRWTGRGERELIDYRTTEE